MEWISVKDRLPEQDEYCWIYGFLHDVNVRFVFEGCFDTKSYDLRHYPCKGPGWEYDTGRSNYVMLDQISHWMPYFIPEPPKE